MKKAIAYVRVSSLEQVKTGISLDLQESKIRIKSDLDDYDLIEVIKDEGYSAKNIQRPGFQKVLSYIKSNSIDSLIIYKIDRLSRNVSDLNNIVQLLNKRDIALISIRDNIDTKSAGGRMVLNVLASISQWEREAIGERTSEALQQKKLRYEKRGGTIPFGYQIKGYIEKESKDGRQYKVPELEECESEQEIIYLMKELKNKGCSYSAIARELEERKIKTKTGRAKWNHKVIIDILQAA